MIVSFLLLSGAVEQGFFSFLLLVSDAFGLGWGPALEVAIAWMPYVTTAAVGNGAADMLAVDVTGFCSGRPRAHRLRPALRGVLRARNHRGLEA